MYGFIFEFRYHGDFYLVEDGYLQLLYFLNLNMYIKRFLIFNFSMVFTDNFVIQR